MNFNELLGNEPVKKSLANMLKSGRVSNSYIFEGMSGIGKKLCAEIFSAGLVCESDKCAPCGTCSGCVKAKAKSHPDIAYITKGDETSIGVDEVREQIINQVYLKPYISKRRIFIIEDGDFLTEAAQNSLLKVLEEPPEYVTFIICVTKQDRLLSTVLSRSVVMTFFPLPLSLVKSYLEEKYGGEKVNLASKVSCGSIGEAINFISDEKHEKLFRDTIDHLKNLSLGGVKMRETADFLIEEKENIDKVTDYMLTFLRDCVFVKTGAESQVIYDDFLSDMRVFTDKISKKGLTQAFDRLSDFKLKKKQNLNYAVTVFETVVCIWEDFHGKGSGHKI